jgi:hypothetical protein
LTCALPYAGQAKGMGKDYVEKTGDKESVKEAYI